MNALAIFRSLHCLRLGFAALLAGAATSHAGPGTDLNFLADSAGAFTPPFSAAVTSYSQTSALPDLLVWPQALDAEAVVEVRANGGAWQRVASGRTLSAGRNHLAVARAGGTVAVWGSNDAGQLNMPAGLTNVVSVACGDSFTLALRANGTVAGWGEEFNGEVSGPATLTGVTSIAASTGASFAVLADGTVRSWGESPVPAGVTGVVRVEAYGGGVRALRRDGTWLAWNAQGMQPDMLPAGSGTSVAISGRGERLLTLQPDGTVRDFQNAGWPMGTAAPPAGLHGVIAIASADRHYLALKSDGTVATWGTGVAAVIPPGLTDVVAVDAIALYSAALQADGSVVVWGDVFNQSMAIPPAGINGSPLRAAAAQPLAPGANTVEVRLTPPAGAPAKTYTLQVNRQPNPSLRLLELERGLLTPAFSTAVTAYTVSLPFANDSLRLRALTFAPGAALQINGQAVASGAWSDPLPLAPGSNVITCRVVAEDGATERSVTLTVTRQPPQSNVALRHLAHMSGPLVPAFAPDQLAYTHSAPLRQPELVLWPRVAQLSAKLEVRANSRPWQEVSTGRQTARPGGIGLVLQPDNLLRAWNPLNISEPLYLPPGLPACAAVGEDIHHGTAIRSDGVPLLWNFHGTQPVAVPPGAADVVETAGSNYVLLALRGDGTVVSWEPNFGTAQLVFSGLNDVITIAGGLSQFTAVRRDGTVVLWSDNVAIPTDVPPGLTEVVDAAPGQFFTVALKRDGTVVTWGSNGNGVTNPPAGLRDVVDVAASGNTALALRADGTVVAWGDPPDNFAAVTGVSQIAGAGSGFMLWRRGAAPVIGPEWVGLPPPGSPPGLTARDLPTVPAVPLDIGANSVQVRVTAEDGTARTYTLAVTREPNADLRALGVDFGALAPAFSSAIFTYSVDLPATRDSLTLSPAADDRTAAVRINGTMVPPGASHTVALTPGSNTLTLTVTAEDGVTSRTITLLVTRALPNTNLRALATSAGLLPALPGTRAQTHRQPGLAVWPRQAAAGAMLECRTAGGTWQRMAAGSPVARSYQHGWVALVLPNGTVEFPPTGIFPNFSVPAGLTGVVAIVAGAQHCAALKSDGTVTAFGADNLQSQWTVPPALTNACALAAAGNFTIALRTDGTLTGWGDNTDGQLNIPAGLSGVVAVRAWSEGTTSSWCLALKSDGTVIGWGRGQAAPFIAPPQMQGAVDIVIGDWKTARALLYNGQVVTWDTQTGIAGGYAPLTGVAAISGSFALRADGSLLNIAGGALPRPVTGDVVAVHGEFGVRADGTVFQFSSPGTSEVSWTLPPLPSHFQLSLPQGATAVEMRLSELGVETVQTLTVTRPADTALRFLATGGGPLTPPFARGVTAFTQTVRQPHYPLWAAPVNAATVVEVRSNGSAWTRLATGPAFSANATFLGVTADGRIAGSITGWNGIETGLRAVSVAEHSSHSLVLLADGLPVGQSIYYTAYPSLRLPVFSEGFSLLAAGDKHALALRRDGTLTTWGETNLQQTNFAGGPLSNVVQVSAGQNHSLALLADGTVRAAGANNFGQATVPAGLSGVVAIAAGFNHSLALRHDGSVTAWGDNTSGQATVPPRVRDIIAIAAGSANSAALSRTGTVHSWGQGAPSELVESSRLAGGVNIMAGKYHAGVLRPDGALQVWTSFFISDFLPPSDFRAAPLGPAAVLPLLYGDNAVEVRVTEPDGTASATTTVQVTRLPNADLTSLKLVAGELTPAFAPGTTEYSTSVPFSTATLRLQMQTVEAGAAVRVNGTLAAGGTAAVPLLSGMNTVTITVTAEDGVTQRTWTLTVTRRAASSQAALRFLSDSAGPLTPLFDPAVNDYTQPAVNLPPLLLHALPNDPRNTVRMALNAQPLPPLETGCRLAGGDRFMLAIKSDGTVAAWGLNVDGQSDVPPGLTDVVSVAAGTQHSVALRRDGSVIAWGRNEEGQTDVPAGLGSVVAIAAGGFKTMALREDGTVVVWGTGYFGQNTVPAGLSNVVAIAAGYTHCLALKGDGTLVTWGENFALPSGMGPVTAIGAGVRISAALFPNGTVLTWPGTYIWPAGSVPLAALDVTGAAAIRRDGTLATTGSVSSNNNAPAALASVSAVWGNRTNGCAMKDDGSFVSWGPTQPAAPAGLTGKTGRSFAAYDLRPGVNVVEASVLAEDGLTTADYHIAITRNPNTVLTSLTLTGAALAPAFSNAVTDFTAAVPAATESITLTATVQDSTSLLEVNGNVAPSGQAVSIPVATGLNEITVRVTAEDGVTTVLRRIMLTRAAWSDNATLRSLGSSQSIPMSVFTPTGGTHFTVPGDPAAITLWPRTADAGAALDFQVDGGAWTPLNRTGTPVLGGNSSFVLALRQNGIPLAWGRSDLGQLTVPAGLTEVISVSAGAGFSLVLRKDGAVFAWGENLYGQTTVPAAVAANATATISAGRNHALALSHTGKVRAWGDTTAGQSDVPGFLSDVTAISGGYTHSLALTRFARVYSWGSMAQSTVPAALPPVVAIAAGDAFSVVLKSDGTVAAWGSNTNGQTTVPAGLSGVTGIACGGRHVLALKQDGTVVAWGDNSAGQRTIPAGLSNVVAVSAGGNLSLALRTNGTVAVWGTNTYGQTTVPAGLLCPPARDHVRTVVHPGVNTIALRVTAADGVTTRTTTVTARGSYLPAYQLWTLTAFPAGTPAATTAATADPDNDGLLNGLEYLLNSDPRTVGHSPLAARAEAGDLIITFPRRAGITDGLETIETAPAPDAAWQTDSAAVIARTPGAAGQPDTVTVRLPRTGSRSFVRLRVTF